MPAQPSDSEDLFRRGRRWSRLHRSAKLGFTSSVRFTPNENARDLSVSGVFWATSEEDRRSHPSACADDEFPTSIGLRTLDPACRCTSGLTRLLNLRLAPATILRAFLEMHPPARTEVRLLLESDFLLWLTPAMNLRSLRDHLLKETVGRVDLWMQVQIAHESVDFTELDAV
jgi:hypothetical protein